MTWTLINADFRKTKMPEPKPGQRVIMVSDFPYSPRVHLGRRTGSSAGGYGGKSKASNAGQCGVVSEIAYDPLTKGMVSAAMKWVKALKPEWTLWFADHVTAQWWEAALKKADQYVFAPCPWIKTDAPARKAGEGPDSDAEWIVPADGVGLDSQMLRRIAQEVDQGFIPEADRILVARHMKRIRRYGNREGSYTEPTASTRSKAGGHKMQGKKPLGLMRKVLRDYAEPGDLVIDLTCGEGTTGVAAIEYGCDFFGCEIREETCLVARQSLTVAAAQIAMPWTVPSYARARQDDAVKANGWDVKKPATLEEA